MSHVPVPIRVLIVDDHPVVRSGLRLLLETEHGIMVAGEAQEGAEAVEKALRLHPDVILMDLVMPGMDGIEATERILANQPKARVLVLTSFAADDKVFPAVRAGALGYILKDTSPAELVSAVHQVYRGESSLHPQVARKVLQELAHPVAREPRGELLTDREVEVLRLLACGDSDERIASTLFITRATVRKHVSSILGKLHLETRTQAALRALQDGLLAPHTQHS